MHHIRALLEKEWLELRHERGLIISTLAFPLLLTIIGIVAVVALGRVPDQDTAQLGAVQVDPALAGLPLEQLGQVVVGRQFGLLFLMMPLFIPSVLASYSIVGEKTRRTLEPLLATPLATWELLVAKSLAALLPAVLLTWLAGAIYVGGVALAALSPQVFGLIITPAWLLLLLLCGPLLALLAVALAVLISSRVNDPRSAQQIAGVVVLPILALFFSQLLGLVQVNIAFVLAMALLLLLLNVLTLVLATRLFQREAILTRWT
ncbi:MAG: ABC transporter permease subunit [Chloroflexaceae bacterium]|jgi:ABC-2 type transport system permease protein|nr:ABC transporter permease subunit [Chloroflexaceae bacterium]